MAKYGWYTPAQVELIRGILQLAAVQLSAVETTDRAERQDLAEQASSFRALADELPREGEKIPITLDRAAMIGAACDILERAAADIRVFVTGGIVTALFNVLEDGKEG